MRRSIASTAKTLEKLETSVEAGNYYEAQQMYKSIYARYVAGQKYTEALDILQSGASIQLKHGQVTCGAELAILFVEVLVKGKYPYNQETLDRVRKIYLEFPQISMPQDLGDDDDMQMLSEALVAAKTRVEGCSSFLKAAIKWSAESGGPRNGSPELHDMLAEYLYSQSPELNPLQDDRDKESWAVVLQGLAVIPFTAHISSLQGPTSVLFYSDELPVIPLCQILSDMPKVSTHFVRGIQPEKFAYTLVNFMGKCYPGEDDLAIARAVLMYLSLGNMRDANCLMDELKKLLESNQLDFPRTDLMQFIIYLLQTLERDALPLFRILRQNYKTSIDRESAFHELLDNIAERFYGVRRRSGLQGMFGDFFKKSSLGSLKNLVFIDAQRNMKRSPSC